MTVTNNDITAQLDDLYCIGCGAKIQTTDSQKAGYLPSGALAKRDLNVYCQRCFRLRHYNEISDVAIDDDEFLALLNTISHADALIVNVVDVFDLNGSLIDGMQRFVGDNPLLVVANKEDLLPKSLKRRHIQDWVRQQLNKNGIKPQAVLLTSAKKNHAIDELLAKIEAMRAGRDVYVVGVTNVGKSTLINQIIRHTTKENQDVITTSRFPGTTLDRIEIPLADNAQLIDTPGIIHRSQMAHYLTPKGLKQALPQAELKPKTYQLNDNQTLFLGGVARFDYVSGPKCGFTCYLSNNLKLHRTKLENADNFYAKHAGKLIYPVPVVDGKSVDLVRHELKVSQTSDVVISGLGWIKVQAGCVIAVWAPKDVAVTLRTSMI